jgi:hypothetical protein
VVRRLGELHIEKARLKALRLVAFTGAVFPGEWMAPYNEAVTSDLLEFAFHARRVNQICELEGVDFGSIKVFQVTISGNDPGDWVEHYGWALDRLMHAREFIFGNCHADHRPIFTSSASNLMPLYVKVATDRREMATISLFGLAECYLNRVVAAVKQKFPDWQF